MAATAEVATSIDWEAVARTAVHPIQLEILERAARGNISPVDLAGELDASIQLIAYHVRQLAGDGLLTLTGTKPRRGALQHFYRLSDTAQETA